ncbi:hypothetical protein L873DRAFT_1146912 [Choiromyces venosus 120613-1]|uniref:Uncharacterized protein n=1 Tax=Choiromyces venosus 120613-1 TaxID=1336337 RepID=A0A3N4JG99_9PEZI|nr:hypothetical protein L873DRAFT_1146912 [Choiromyces venosus 120613-1]
MECEGNVLWNGPRHSDPGSNKPDVLPSSGFRRVERNTRARVACYSECHRKLTASCMLLVTTALGLPPFVDYYHKLTLVPTGQNTKRSNFHKRHPIMRHSMIPKSMTASCRR